MTDFILIHGARTDATSLATAVLNIDSGHFPMLTRPRNTDTRH